MEGLTEFKETLNNQIVENNVLGFWIAGINR